MRISGRYAVKFAKIVNCHTTVYIENTITVLFVLMCVTLVLSF